MVGGETLLITLTTGILLLLQGTLTTKGYVSQNKEPGKLSLSLSLYIYIYIYIYVYFVKYEYKYFRQPQSLRQLKTYHTSMALSSEFFFFYINLP